MTGSTALDIVIGLTFIYLLYSLFATLIQEILATNLSFRAKILEIAIIRMLNDDDTSVKSYFQNFFKRLSSIRKLLFARENKLLTNNSLAHHFYQNPLIKYLAQDSWHSKPSYLDKTNFSKVLIDILRGDDPKPGQDFRPAIQDSLDKGIVVNNTAIFAKQGDTLRFLKSLCADSQGDIEKFRTALETWYDNTMERATGWYKQYTQVVLLFIGFFVAAAFNVDTLLIIDKLSSNPKLTAQVVQQADNFLKAHPNFQKEIDTLKIKAPAEANKLIAREKFLSEKTKELLDKDIKNLNQLLGLGWEEVKTKNRCSGEWVGWFWSGCRPAESSHWFMTLIGWLLTALAISLGAPFWFDLLNRLMKLRSSVAATGKSDGKSEKTEKKETIVPEG